MQIVTRGLELRGAYGRETNMQDWLDGKDFKITGGPYCSIRDMEEMKKEGFHLLEFRKQDGTFLKLIPLHSALHGQTEPGQRVLNEG